MAINCRNDEGHNVFVSFFRGLFILALIIVFFGSVLTYIVTCVSDTGCYYSKPSALYIVALIIVHMFFAITLIVLGKVIYDHIMQARLNKNLEHMKKDDENYYGLTPWGTRVDEDGKIDIAIS
jgi:predicted PurR-regulated permease PerM